MKPKSSLRERTCQGALDFIPLAGPRAEHASIVHGYVQGALHGPPIEFAIKALEIAERQFAASGLDDYAGDCTWALAEIRKARGDVTDQQ